MTLSDVLKEYNNRDFNAIEYRTIASIDSDDVDLFIGMAAYKNKMLVSLDGDSYSLNDQIVKHELFRDDWLVVYKETTWRKGK